MKIKKNGKVINLTESDLKRIVKEQNMRNREGDYRDYIYRFVEVALTELIDEFAENINSEYGVSMNHDWSDSYEEELFSLFQDAEESIINLLLKHYDNNQ
jgi:hypothetical protein